MVNRKLVVYYSKNNTEEVDESAMLGVMFNSFEEVLEFIKDEFTELNLKGRNFLEQTSKIKSKFAKINIAKIPPKFSEDVFKFKISPKDSSDKYNYEFTGYLLA